MKILVLGTLLCSMLYTTQVPLAKVTLSDLDGNELLDICTKPPGPELQFCEAFILGVRDGASLASMLRDAKPIFVAPPEVKQKQLKAVVVKYLNDHPEEQHKPAAELVIWALRNAFPPQ